MTFVRRVGLGRIWAVLIGVLTVGTMVTAAQAAELTVTIQDVRNADGYISVAIYNSRDHFLEDGAYLQTRTVRAMPGDIPVSFNDLPPGSYAAAAFHDENASGDFDTSFLGLPEEGYGFSNGASALFGPPAFEDAEITLATNRASAKIELSY